MSKSKFIHTLSESKNIFVLEQKAIVLSFVKNVASLLGHTVFLESNDVVNGLVLTVFTVLTIALNKSKSSGLLEEGELSRKISK